MQKKNAIPILNCVGFVSAVRLSLTCAAAATGMRTIRIYNNICIAHIRSDGILNSNKARIKSNSRGFVKISLGFAWIFF